MSLGLLYSWIKGLALPPVSLFLLILLGLIWWRHPWRGRGLVFLSTAALLILSLPIVAARLMGGLEPYPALSALELDRSEAQAILVLGAGRYTGAPEYGGDDIGPLTLQRLRYAALLQRRTGLPLYVSAGGPQDEQPPLAHLMKRSLERDFRVPVAGIEDRSRSTWENARFSAELLQRAQIRHILLVSHAWHLPRAVEAFERAGFSVTPAPTTFSTRDDDEIASSDYLPVPRALLTSHYAIHEYLGRLWYQIRHRMQ